MRAGNAKDVYGPNYRKPWVRRSFPHQRTHLSDHREYVILLALVVALIGCALLLYIQTGR